MIRLKVNNKGISLIEVIVALAMASIIFLAVAGFMKSGVTSFCKYNKSVNLQTSSQICYDKISDVLKPTISKNLTIKAKNTSGSSYEYINTPDDTTGGLPDGEVWYSVYNMDPTDTNYLAVEWSDLDVEYINTGEKTIVYNSTDKKVYINNYESGMPVYTEESEDCYADNCTKFKISLDEMNSNIVKVSLEFTADGKAYQIDKEILLRNSDVFK